MAAAGSTHLPGFSDPVLDAQTTFRLLLASMSRPGTVHELPTLTPAPFPLFETTAAVCLTLLDLHTPIWMDIDIENHEAAADYLRFHCGCPIVLQPSDASFALITSQSIAPSLSAFNPGTPEFPDRSTTLIIQVAGLTEGQGQKLTGPGIAGEHSLAIDGLDNNFFDQLRRNRSLYPLGVDLFLVSPQAVCSLPRTVRVEDK